MNDLEALVREVKSVTYLSIWGATLAFATGHDVPAPQVVKKCETHPDIAADKLNSAVESHAIEQRKCALQS